MRDGGPRVRRRGSGLRARLRSVARVASLVLLVSVSGILAPAAADDLGPATSTHDTAGGVCAEAQRLLGEGRPSQALDLIARHRGTDAAGATSGSLPEDYYPDDACRDERALALVHIERGKAYTAIAAQLAAEEASSAQADNASATSAQPVTVPPGCPEVGAARNLTAEQVKALSQQCDRGEEEEESGLFTGLRDAWQSAEEKIVTPLAVVLLPIGLVALGLLVAARLVIPFVRRWPVIDRSGPWLLLLSAASVVTAATCVVTGLMDGAPKGLGVLLMAVGALVLLVGAISPAGLPRALRQAVLVASALLGILALVALISSFTRPLLFVSGLLLSLSAVSLVALEMATRLRLSLGVRDPSETAKETSVGHLIALLEEMGGDGPRGLEVPRGSDVTALTSSVIATDPANAVLKALWSAWQLLVGPIPWRIQVDEDPAGRLNIVMTRNGRAAGAVVVDPSTLVGVTSPSGSESGAKDAGPLDAYRFVSAAILMRLSRHHPFPLLYNVVDWRSLGYHCVATLDLGEGAGRRQMLERARSHQPDSRPTRLALRQGEYRKATEATDLGDFVSWLDEFIADLPPEQGRSPLALRAHNLRVTALINLHYPASATAGPVAASAPVALVSALDAFRAAVAGAVQESRPADRDGTNGFATIMEGRVRWLRAAYLDEGVLDLRESTPREAYSSACYHASVSARYDEAVRLLKISDVDPDYRQWRPQDPQLCALHRSPAYRQAYPPRTEVLELTPLARAREALELYGVSTLSSLASLPRDSGQVARMLGLSLTDARHVVATAEVVSSLSEQLPDHAVEVTHALAERDLVDLARLRTWAARQPEVLVSSVERAVRKRLDTVPGDLGARLTTWLLSV